MYNAHGIEKRQSKRDRETDRYRERQRERDREMRREQCIWGILYHLGNEKTVFYHHFKFKFSHFSQFKAIKWKIFFFNLLI